MLNPIQIIRYASNTPSITHTPNIIDAIKAAFRFLIYPLIIILCIFFALTHSVYTQYVGTDVLGCFLISLILYITDMMTLCIKLLFKKSPKQDLDKACLILTIYEIAAVAAMYLCYLLCQ